MAEDKIAIYDKGIDKRAILGQHMDFDHPTRAIQLSKRDILLPQVNFSEPLRTEARPFVDCLRTGKTAHDRHYSRAQGRVHS